MLDELLRQQGQQQASPQEDVINMKEQSRYISMMNSLKAKIGKAEKAKVDSEVAEREAQIAIEEAKAQGMA